MAGRRGREAGQCPNYHCWQRLDFQLPEGFLRSRLEPTTIQEEPEEFLDEESDLRNGNVELDRSEDEVHKGVLQVVEAATLLTRVYSNPDDEKQFTRQAEVVTVLCRPHKLRYLGSEDGTSGPAGDRFPLQA